MKRCLKFTFVIAVIICSYCFCINNYNVEAKYDGTTKVTAQIIAPSTVESSNSSSVDESSGSAVVTGDNTASNVLIYIIVLICCIAAIIFIILRKNQTNKINF